MMKNWRVLNKDCELRQTQLSDELCNILVVNEALEVWLYQDGKKKADKC